MLKTSMLFQEESRIFNELLSRFDALSEEQNAGGGRDAGMVHEGLAGHLAHWEQGAAEQVRELQAGTWSPRKRTLEEAEQINREVTVADRATLVRNCDSNSAARGQKSYRLCETLQRRWMRPFHLPGSFARSVCSTEVTIWCNCVLGRAFAKWAIVRNEFGTDHFAAKRARRPGGR